MSGYCANHPAVEATDACADCKKPICSKCTKGTLDGFMCPTCAQKRYGRRKLMTGLKVGGLIAVMLGVGVFGLIVVGKGSEKGPPAPPKKQQTADDVVVEQLRKERDRDPCNQALVRKLVREQNRQGDELDRPDRFEGAVDDATAHLAKCDDFPRLRWDMMYALEQLERFPEAIKQSTILITRDPYDPDFWWWRAEDRGKSQQPALALADYRQSFANSEDADRSRYAAARILDVVEAAVRPCEGVAAMRFFVDVHGGALGSSLADRRDTLDRTGDCELRRGKGQASLPSLAKGPARVDVTVGGVQGRFQIDERCGTTVMTRAFAARAAVAAAPAPGGPMESVAIGAIRSGTPATVDLALGDATVAAVDVVVVDELPDQLDGVVCLSLLWRFDLERRDDGGLTLVGE